MTQADRSAPAVDFDGSVLVVDDTPSKRYVLASWLRRRGYPVVEASTGTEALERFREGGIGLVVLDVRLPDISGFEVCEQMKADPVHGTTPVVHVSAAAIHAFDRTQGLERGADAYLVEPIDPDELLATISSVLRYYQARLHAERLATRLTNLARVSVAMSAARGHEQVLREAVTGAVEIFGCPVGIVTTNHSGVQVAAASPGPGQPVEIRPWPGEAGEPPVGVRYTDQPAGAWPLTRWPDGALVRVLTVRTRLDRPPLFVVVPREATQDGVPVLSLLGQSVMSALNVMRLLDEEHDVALTLQRSLLPRRLPHVDGLELAVRYVPASERAEIGGDFYEAVRLDGQLMVAVGDVGGHSLHAATVMAELRHATRAYVAEGHPPADVLDRLNGLMTALIPGEIATLCLLAIDIGTGNVRLANAGHPPPVLTSSAGVRVITGHSSLLGIRAQPPTEVQFALEPGDTLVLYTDGLIETRVETLDQSLARLTAAAATVEPDLEEFASRLLADVGPAKARDDIAMVVVRRVG
jgi:CheY-like chemotaxis protein